jgi:3-hydroxyisobutyrate dehydrogenase
MQVGFIGTGLMGLPMAQRVMAAGFPLIVYNRTIEKLEPLREAGIVVAADPSAAIYAATFVVLMLTDAQAIRDVVLSDESRRALAGKTIIQMGTIAPSESRAIQQEILAADGNYLEAPVLGSIPEAKSGQLIVMVGGTAAQFESARQVLRCFGPEPILVGPVGAAAAVKLALNQLIGSLTTAFATSLGFVQQQEVDLELFMQILRQSVLYAPTFDKKLQRMLDRNYDQPNFPTKHLLKDTNLFLQAANDAGLNASLVAAVSQILNQTVEQGLAEADYSALFSTVSPPVEEEEDPFASFFKWRERRQSEP